MARLPDPITGDMEIACPEDYKLRESVIYKMAAIAIDKAIKEKKRKEGKEEKD